MAGRIVPIHIGNLELQVETAPVAGTEPTSKTGDATRAVVDAYSHAQAAIVEIATSVAATVDQVTERARRPARVDVEFGLKFSAKGTVFVAEASGEATLRVLVSYDAAGQSTLPSS